MKTPQREEHGELGEQLEALLRRQAAPASPIGRDEEVFRAAWRLLGEGGVFALPLPAAPGEPTRGCDAVAAFEALGLECSDLGFLFAASAHLWGTVLPLALHASPEQRARWLGGLVDGSTISAHAVTEPEAGSDVGSLQTRIQAVDGGEWLQIDGSKCYITAAPLADLFVVYGRDAQGLRAVLVPADAEGLVVEDSPKMGLLGTPMGSVVFEACRVPVDHALGPAGAGLALFQGALEWERVGIVAPLLGAMQRQLDRSVAHARSRAQFGQPIGRFQAVSHRIADMKLRLDVGRLLVERAARLKDEGLRAPVEAAEAKLWVTEAFLEGSVDALRTQGAAGYLEGSPEARDLRDAAAGPLYSGTSDIQRNIIARFLGL